MRNQLRGEFINGIKVWVATVGLVILISLGVLLSIILVYYAIKFWYVCIPVFIISFSSVVVGARSENRY